MKLRNINPLGEVELFDLRGNFVQVLAAGGEFDVPDDLGAALLEQVGNYERASAKKETAK